MTITFTPGTKIPSTWLNDINTVAYTYFGDGVNLNSPTKLQVTTGLFSTNLGIGLTPGRTLDVLGPSNATTARIVRNDAGIASNFILELQNGSGGGTTVASVDSIGTARFSTSVVTPAINATAGLFLSSGAGGALQFSSGTGVVSCNSDNTTIFGDATHRWITGFFTALDSGTSGSMSLQTNNGKTQSKIVSAGDGTNFANIQGAATTFAPVIFSNGGDTNIGLIFGSKGTSSIDFTTGGTFTGDVNTGRLTQFQVLHTAGATRALTGTGSNGGQPILGATAGGVAIVGTTGQNDAAAGQYGEFQSATVSSGSPVTLTTNTAANVTSLTSATNDNIIGHLFDFETPATVPTAGSDQSWVMPTARFSLSGNTTIFLVAQATFTVSTLKAYGTMRARRMR